VLPVYCQKYKIMREALLLKMLGSPQRILHGAFPPRLF